MLPAPGECSDGTHSLMWLHAVGLSAPQPENARASKGSPDECRACHLCAEVPWPCSETLLCCRKDVPPKEKPFRAADVDKVLAVRDAEAGQEVFVKLKGEDLPALVLLPLYMVN